MRPVRPNHFWAARRISSIPRLRSLEVFLFSKIFRPRTGLSTKTVPCFYARNQNERSVKMKVRSLAFASLFVLSVASVRAITIAENFSNAPAQDGWQIFGNTSLFQWNSGEQNLAVTWDSSEPNSYFYHPLGTILTKADDFSFAFDLRLNDIASGNETGKTGPMGISLGLQNFAAAKKGLFLRGV